MSHTALYKANISKYLIGFDIIISMQIRSDLVYVSPHKFIDMCKKRREMRAFNRRICRMSPWIHIKNQINLQTTTNSRIAKRIIKKIPCIFLHRIDVWWLRVFRIFGRKRYYFFFQCDNVTCFPSHKHFSTTCSFHLFGTRLLFLL